MKEEMRTFGYLCPQCGKTVMGTRSVFALEASNAEVECACGEVIETASTKKDITVEICSKCHSFYTGQQKAAAARGRIDKFNRKYGITK